MAEPREIPWCKPWYQNMATEFTQYSTIRCGFLREELLRLLSVFAELYLRVKYLNILSRSFDKVDEIDVFRTDCLGEARTLTNEESNGLSK